MWLVNMHDIENGHRTAIKTFPLFVVCKNDRGALQYYRGHKWPKWTNELAKAIFYPLEKSAKGVITFQVNSGYKNLFISHFFVEGELYDKREETT